MFPSPIQNRRVVTTFNRFTSFAGLPRKSYHPNKAYRPYILAPLVSQNGTGLIATKNETAGDDNGGSDPP